MDRVRELPERYNVSVRYLPERYKDRNYEDLPERYKKSNCEVLAEVLQVKKE